ncbi:MAG TPA: methyltransferase domain-containing protein [Patescibacteria group bacterium]|nr:methyltransferase domain-containing protein [Patescibacteria group bacterium]
MFFVPRTIYETETPVSGKIAVAEDRTGVRKLIVGGLVQSVYDPRSTKTYGVWDGFIQLAQERHETVQKILILGLGAGTSAAQFLSVYPNAYVVGVEIEPKIIEIGQRYFHLADPRIRSVCADASTWVKETKEKGETFDVICVDMYIGDRIPIFCESEEFLQILPSLSTQGGSVIFNRLYYGKKKVEADAFIEKLRTSFKHIDTKVVKGEGPFKNILIIVGDHLSTVSTKPQ